MPSCFLLTRVKADFSDEELRFSELTKPSRPQFIELEAQQGKEPSKVTRPMFLVLLVRPMS